MHLLFEASLTQPICLVKNRSSSGVQVPATCEKAWRAVPSKSDTKQSNGKPNDKPKQKRVAVCFSFLRVAFCFQDLFRSSHLRAVFLLRVASFFWFSRGLRSFDICPPPHTRTCLWTCFLRVFAFLFAIMIVARMAAMVAWNACHLLSVIAHAVCSTNSLPMPVATCSVCIEMCHWNRR